MRWLLGLGCCMLVSLVSLGDGLADDLLPPELPPEQAIDQYIDAKLQRAGVSPAPVTEDANFLRRVMLDLTGRPPYCRGGEVLYRRFRCRQTNEIGGSTPGIAGVYPASGHRF